MNGENDFQYSAEETNANFDNTKKKAKGSSIIMPFFAGVLGAGITIGMCFGIPDVKTKIVGELKTTKLITSSDENKTTIDITNYSENAVTVAEKALPSVVGITVKYQVNTFMGSSSEAKATGSGIIVTKDGYIVTNNHVIAVESSLYYEIEEATEITVNLYGDETPYKATIIGTDEYTDIAVLKIEKDNLTPAVLGNSEKARVGEVVYAIGNPLGMDYSVTSGIISAKNREVDAEGTTYTAIQTDAAINSGNSGGALVNTSGQVIGINTLKLSGEGIEGIGFAIPISSATEIIEQLIQYKTVKRPYIGIGGTSIDNYTAKRYNLPEGIYVESVEKDSPAEKAGIKKGDIITKIEGKEVSSVTQLNKIKYKYNIGDTVTLTIYDKGKENDVKVKLTEMPSQN